MKFTEMNNWDFFQRLFDVGYPLLTQQVPVLRGYWEWDLHKTEYFNPIDYYLLYIEKQYKWKGIAFNTWDTAKYKRITLVQCVHMYGCILYTVYY